MAIIAQRAGQTGLRFGDSCGTGLSGNWWEGDDQHARRELDLAPGLNTTYGRRLEVVADGLSLFQGAQLAIDTTLVSALRADGTPRPRAATTPGAALADARSRKETTYPELVGEGSRAKLVV